MNYDGYHMTNMMDIKGEFVSMIYKFFYKKSASLAWSETLAARNKSASSSGVKSEIM